MWSISVLTLKTGTCITAQIQEILQHGKVLHRKHDGGRKCGGMARYISINICSVVKKQLHGLQAAMADGYEQWVNEVDIGVGSSLQQELCGIDVVVKNSKIERSGAPVLIKAGAFIREGGVDIVASVNQLFQDVVVVAFGRKVQWADATTLDAGAAGHGDQHGDNPARWRVREWR